MIAAPSTPPRSHRERPRTPTAPQFGSRYDDYEPFTPRRSSRISSMRDRDLSPEAGSSRQAASQIHSSFTSTSAPKRKTKLTRQLSNQTLSPPSSPETPQQPLHTTPPPPSSQQASTPASLFRPRKQLFADTVASNADNQPSPFKNAPLSLATFDPTSMFPTPDKTPRKRASVATGSTARILNFKPGNLDEVMPTPRKQRKARFLQTLEEEGIDGLGDDKIEIYTDSKDRVPDLDESEDNPFVGPRKTPQPKRKSARHASSSNGKDADMEEAVRNEEGIIYVFRGKKFLRRFADSDVGDNDIGDIFSASSRLARQAGAAAQRPFTRSTLERRLLFPSEEQLRERERRASASDEEAPTDIEISDDDAPTHTPAATTTPMKKASTSTTPATPPTTLRTTRFGSAKKTPVSASKGKAAAIPDITVSANYTHLATVKEESDPDVPSSTPVPQVRGKKAKTSPFDHWKRTKASGSSSTAPHGVKRERGGEAVEQGAPAHSPAKRTRSSFQVHED